MSYGIVRDLRRSNGKPNSTIFDTFWSELQTYLDEINPAIDERRQGETLHMPFAIPLRHLQEIVTERLQQKFPEVTPAIPSLEWICGPQISIQILLSGTWGGLT